MTNWWRSKSTNIEMRLQSIVSWLATHNKPYIGLVEPAKQFVLAIKMLIPLIIITNMKMENGADISPDVCRMIIYRNFLSLPCSITKQMKNP